MHSQDPLHPHPAKPAPRPAAMGLTAGNSRHRDPPRRVAGRSRKQQHNRKIRSSMRRWKPLTRACRQPLPDNRDRSRAALRPRRIHPVARPQAAQVVRPAAPARRAMLQPRRRPVADHPRAARHRQRDPRAPAVMQPVQPVPPVGMERPLARRVQTVPAREENPGP